MYSFVGKENLLTLVKPEHKGIRIYTPGHIDKWIITNAQKPDFNHEIIVTFVIDKENNLRINDRRSEHVVCAGGEPVLSAGEMTFQLRNNKTQNISQITNLSTGYCPCPSSWRFVKQALDSIGMQYPDGFSPAFIFRICKNCQTINVIKDDYFVCLNCDKDLPVEEEK